MRDLLVAHVFRADVMIHALALNSLLLCASSAAFLLLLRSARRLGSLMQMGE